jgi:hypothetical protein
LLFVTATSAQADIITFDLLATNGNNRVGSTYSEGDYNLSTNGPTTSPFGFWSVNAGAPNGRYLGSTSLFNNTSGGVITLQRADGKPFDLNSMMLAELGAGNPWFNINFTGTRYYGGSSVGQGAPVNGGAINSQTTIFGGFEALSSVSWQQLSPFHQFDNIDLNATSLVPPTTLFASSMYRVANGFNGDVTGDVLQGGTALVGNLNSLNPGTAPDYRGFAKFILDRPELATATSALLSLTPILGNLPPNPTLHLNVALEAFLTPIGLSNQVSDFQAAPISIPSIVFNTSTLTLNQVAAFDVTAHYNLAIQNDMNLTFRLRQKDETGDFRPLNWGFSNFQLALDYTQPEVTGVPEPASIALLGLTALGGIGLRWRQRRRARTLR